MQDKPLFGPVDQVVNTLEIETSWVKGEIKRREGAIDRNRDEITLLQTRLDNLNESMRIVRENEKKREEAEVQKPAPKPAPKAGAKASKTPKARKS